MAHIKSFGELGGAVVLMHVQQTELKEGASPHASPHAGGNNSDGDSSDDGMNDYYAGGEKRCASMRARLSSRECMGSDFQRPTLCSQRPADQGRSCQKEGVFGRRKFGSRSCALECSSCSTLELCWRRCACRMPRTGWRRCSIARASPALLLGQKKTWPPRGLSGELVAHWPVALPM